MQFPGGCGAWSKTGELSKTNSCSVEQAISYFTVNGLLKQELLFSLMTFYQSSANVFFFTAYTIDWKGKHTTRAS